MEPNRDRPSICTVRRILLVAVALAAGLLTTGGAQAKAPPDGVDICGATGTCVHVTMEAAENEWALWLQGSQTDADATAPAPSAFYVVRWHWDSDARTAYYVPAAGRVRQLDERGAPGWWRVHDPASLRQLTSGLEAFTVPTIARVTVGGREVRDPQSYLQLFGRGRTWWPLNQQHWLRVRVTADAASPWTDAASDLRISRRGRYLWVDGTIFKIPLQLARRVRSRVSLRG
jgi:hypothetical protein